MPTAADKLSSGAGKQETSEAVSSCISQMMKEGYDQDQAAAICYSKARESTGVRRKEGTRRVK